MNAFPMIATCALRQGRGLVQAARRTSDWEEWYVRHTAFNEEHALKRLQREVERSERG